ncbi:MAG: DEAD/DEAH box helicase [Candidatus Omnitrophica bacterium]|nr:DEAD/DEAH box helicase [Candidatus Omnitrophota bacterium]
MFDMLKIFKGQEIHQGEFIRCVNNLGYRRRDDVDEEGDFCYRGEVVEIFPVTFESPVKIVWDEKKIDSLRGFNIATGELFSYYEVIIILPCSEKAHHIKTVYERFDENFPIQNFVEIKPGDYVVHVIYGIGIYEGRRKIRLDKNRFQDCLVLRYKDGAKLYVPQQDMHLIQKYIGFEGRPPRMYRLGAKEWQRVKERSRKGIWSKAQELLEMHAKRKILTGFSFSPDSAWQKELEKSFPYKETPDQIKATLEVKRDMESPYPMDRLICGDVGYGKTEVALRAAFKAVMDNKQVAILVPTTILAEQHYHTFKTRMQHFPVNIEMLSRFRSEEQQKEIVTALNKGIIDIVIGTHRLLSPDIKFKDLGLVITDEEQRFGVEHKEKLKKLRLLVDVLTLTATPIPRTLYMALMGTRDMSVINTPPKERMPVETRVCEYDEGFIRRVILNELGRNGQVFFVHNRIEGIEKIARRLSQIIPEASIGVAHGKLPERMLEKVMLDFIEKRFNVLVCTTIIESGIDIPNVNTILVNHADHFGLSDLIR